VRTLFVVRAAQCSGFEAPVGLCAPSFLHPLALVRRVGFLGEAPVWSCFPVVRELLVVRAARFSGVDSPVGLCVPFSCSHWRALAAPRAWV